MLASPLPTVNRKPVAEGVAWSRAHCSSIVVVHGRVHISFVHRLHLWHVLRLLEDRRGVQHAAGRPIMSFQLSIHRLLDQASHPHKGECTQLMKYNTVMDFSVGRNDVVMHHTAIGHLS